MSPLVSIIVPCYNYAHFLSDTLANISSQEFEDWECIIIDDGSTDPTSEVAGKFLQVDPRFRYHYKQNGGLAAARNSGLMLAKGEFIQFLDADDFISPDKLSHQTQFMIQQTSIDISYTQAFYFFSDRPEERYGSFSITDQATVEVKKEHWIPQITGAGNAVLGDLVLYNIAPVNCMLTRKTLLDKVGGFDESYSCLEDWDLWLRCAFNGARFSFLDHRDAFATVRIHTTSMSHNRFDMSLQRIRRLMQSRRIIEEKQPSDLDRLVPTLNPELAKGNLCNLINKAGYLNIPKLSRISKILGRATFIKTYFSALNRYIKGAY